LCHCTSSQQMTLRQGSATYRREDRCRTGLGFCVSSAISMGGGCPGRSVLAANLPTPRVVTRNRVVIWSPSRSASDGISCPTPSLAARRATITPTRNRLLHPPALDLRRWLWLLGRVAGAQLSPPSTAGLLARFGTPSAARHRSELLHAVFAVAILARVNAGRDVIRPLRDTDSAGRCASAARAVHRVGHGRGLASSVPA